MNSSTLLLNLLANAVVVLLMVPIILVLCRIFKNPHVQHGLWALVLIKFLTPPLFDWPVPHWNPADAFNEREERLVALQALGVVPAAWTAAAEPEAGSEGPAVWDTALAWTPTVAWWTWLAGSLGWFGLCLSRALRFHRFLKLAAHADAAQQAELAVLGQRLGVRTIPEMRLTDQPLPPLLWVVPGQSVLLLPRPLLVTLTPEQREALLAHELAHLQRKDHWFRLLEAIVLGLFWWHPCAWLARNRLQHAEEQCCDAWVLGAYPDRSRSYASALLETVDFLAESRHHLPVAASGFGQVNVLRSRFEMILTNTLPRRLSWPMRLALLAVAACILPVAPGLAKADDEQNQRKKDRQARIQKLINELKKELDEADVEENKQVRLKVDLKLKKESDENVIKLNENVDFVTVDPAKKQAAAITVITDDGEKKILKNDKGIFWVTTTEYVKGQHPPIHANAQFECVVKEQDGHKLIFFHPKIMTHERSPVMLQRVIVVTPDQVEKLDKAQLKEGVFELHLVPKLDKAKPEIKKLPKYKEKSYPEKFDIKWLNKTDDHPMHVDGNILYLFYPDTSLPSADNDKPSR